MARIFFMWCIKITNHGMHDMFAWLGIRRLVQDCLIFDANSWDLDNTFYIVFLYSAQVLLLLFGYFDGVGDGIFDSCVKDNPTQSIYNWIWTFFLMANTFVLKLCSYTFKLLQHPLAYELPFFKVKYMNGSNDCASLIHWTFCGISHRYL